MHTAQSVPSCTFPRAACYTRRAVQKGSLHAKRVANPVLVFKGVVKLSTPFLPLSLQISAGKPFSFIVFLS